MEDLSIVGFPGMEAMALVQVHQADGSLDENITFLHIQTAAVLVFLASEANMVINFRGCAGE